jgi:signal peptidase I
MGKLVRGLFWIAVVVAVLVGVGRIFFFDAWTLPDEPRLGASVAPSLAGGDTVLYMRRQAPGFGDLVRCADTEDGTHFVVGRVVGLSGDVVETHDRELSVNGTRYIGEMACAEPRFTIPHPTSGSLIEIGCDQVSIAGHPHLRGSSERPGASTPTKTTVGRGMLYLLSDDRTYHQDSRDFGTVPVESCTGRIVFRLWGKEGWGDDKRRMTFVQ